LIHVCNDENTSRNYYEIKNFIQNLKLFSSIAQYVNKYQSLISEERRSDLMSNFKLKTIEMEMLKLIERNFRYTHINLHLRFVAVCIKRHKTTMRRLIHILNVLFTLNSLEHENEKSFF
jgi:hypothetical protein